MTAVFTRRQLLGVGAGFAAATAGSVAGAVGLGRDGSLRSRARTGAERLEAWTAASAAFSPSDESGPYDLAYADLPTLRRVESTVDGRLRAIPHRWLDRLSSLLEADLTSVGWHVRLSGRGTVQVHEHDHDRERVARRLRAVGYDPVTSVGAFDVYEQPPPENTRELRTVPHLDDAIATDGRYIVTCGRPGLEEPVPPLVATLRARLGARRFVDVDAATAKLLAGVSRADLLTVVPVIRDWVGDGSGPTGSLRAYGRAVRFGASSATVRSVLLYRDDVSPDLRGPPSVDALRSQFLSSDRLPGLGVDPVDRLRVDRRSKVAVLTAEAPVDAFTQ